MPRKGNLVRPLSAARGEEHSSAYSIFNERSFIDQYSIFSCSLILREYNWQLVRVRSVTTWV